MEDRETEPTRRISQNLLLVSLVPIGLFVVVFAFLFYRFGGAIEMKATPWTDMVKLLVLFVVAALSALGARALLTPILRAGRPEPVAADPNNLLRSRMAPFVLALGGSAIVLLTLTLIIAFAILASKSTVLQGKIEFRWRAGPVLTFGGGANEIQRDIIAMAGLWMPRTR